MTNLPASRSLSDILQHGIVAVVDDDEHIGRAITMLMQLKNVEAVSFASAEALLEAVKSSEGQIWLQGKTEMLPLQFAVIDLNLPGLSGVALAHKLRELSPQLRMVIMTAAMPDERALHGPEPEGVGCLIKPFRIAELEQVLSGVH